MTNLEAKLNAYNDKQLCSILAGLEQQKGKLKGDDKTAAWEVKWQILHTLDKRYPVEMGGYYLMLEDLGRSVSADGVREAIGLN